MLKTITAAFVVASMLTAPAFAAGSARKADTAPVTKSAAINAKAGNAKAQMAPVVKKLVVKKQRHAKQTRKHIRHPASKASIDGKAKIAKPVTKQSAMEMRS